MNTEKSFLNNRLTYRLDVLAQTAIAANDAIFVRETGCRIRELRVLRLIDDTPGTTFAAISKATGFERSLTSRIIQKLLGADLIRRENSKEDARVFRLHTTEDGKRIRQVARRLSDQLEIILTRPLSANELAQLNGMLDQLGTWVKSDAYAETLVKDPVTSG